MANSKDRDADYSGSFVGGPPLMPVDEARRLIEKPEEVKAALIANIQELIRQGKWRPLHPGNVPGQDESK